MGCAVSSASVTPSLHEHRDTQFAGLPTGPGQKVELPPGITPSPSKRGTGFEESISALSAEKIVTFASSGRFADSYLLGPVLGVGSFATVRLCTPTDADRASQQAAVKIVKLSGAASTRVLGNRMSLSKSQSARRSEGTYNNKSQSFRSSASSEHDSSREDLVASDKLGDLKYLWREIDTMKDISHPAIIQFHGVYLSSTAARVYIVMQYLPGGELLGMLQKKGRFTEPETHQVMVPLLKALEYIHKRGIVHRDLKLENLMLEDASDLSTVKLCDFGLAKFVGDCGVLASIRADALDHEMSVSSRHDLHATLCGTRVYMPPELVQRSRGACSTAADMWSVGIAFFTMLTGRLPFSPAKDQDGGYERIWHNIVHWQPRVVLETSSAWSGISRDAKECLLRMVENPPQKRCTATEALADTWVTRKQADAQPPSPAQPQHGIYNLSPAGSPRLELAQRLLLEAAVRNGHAPHLYTKGEWIAGALATGSAKDGDNVFLVTRGDLEVVEGGRGVDDNAGAGAGCKSKMTALSTQIECSMPGLIISNASLLRPHPQSPGGSAMLARAPMEETQDSAYGSDRSQGLGGKGAVRGCAFGDQPSRSGSFMQAASSNRKAPLIPLSVRVISSSAEAYVIPADLVRALMEDEKDFGLALRGDAAGGRSPTNKSLVLLGTGREHGTANKFHAAI